MKYLSMDFKIAIVTGYQFRRQFTSEAIGYRRNDNWLGLPTNLSKTITATLLDETR